MILVVLATREADEIIAASRADLAASFPMRGQALVRAILDGGPLTGRGLLCFNPFATGRRALTSFAIDGRRTPAAVCDYADAAERLRRRTAR